MAITRPTTRPTTRATTRATTLGTADWQSPITTNLVIDVPGDLLDSQRMRDFSPAGDKHLVLTSGRGVVGDGVVGFGLVPSAGLTDVASFSVSFWLNPGTLAAGDTYLARWDTGAGKRVFAIRATGTSPSTIAILTSVDGAAELTWTSTAAHLVNGTLIHVVWTYSAGTAVLYINGVAVAGAGDTAAALFGTDIGLSILASLNSAAVANAASGTIRDVRFHSVVLTPAQAAAMFANPEYSPYNKTNGLEGKWRCASSLAASLTGQPVVDSSGHGRHGVWTGCAGAGSRVGGPQSALWSFSSRAWLNGSTQYVTLAAPFSPGTADFYVEFSLFGNVATGTSQRLLSCEDSDTDGLRIQLTGTGVLSAVVNGTTVTSGLTLANRTKYRIRFQRVGDLFNFVVDGVPGATTEIVAADIAVTAAARIGARSHTSAAFYANDLIYDIDLNGALIPGTGNQVADWQTGATVTGSPGNFLVPAQPGDVLDAFGDTPGRVRLAGALNLFGELEYGQLPVASPQAALTFVCWVRNTLTTVTQNVLNGQDGSNDGPMLRQASNSQRNFFVDAVGNAGGAGTAGVWEQWAGTWDGVNAVMYINGVQVDSDPATMTGTTALIRVGAFAYSLASALFRGQLAHPLVFSDAKTGPEILALFDFEKARYGL